MNQPTKPSQLIDQLASLEKACATARELASVLEQRLGGLLRDDESKNQAPGTVLLSDLVPIPLQMRKCGLDAESACLKLESILNRLEV